MSIPAFAAGLPATALSIVSARSVAVANSRPRTAAAPGGPAAGPRRASSVPPLAVVRAEGREVALPAPRPDRLAYLLPEPHEPLVHVEPVLLRDDPLEGLLPLPGRPGTPQ